MACIKEVVNVKVDINGYDYGRVKPFLVSFLSPLRLSSPLLSLSVSLVFSFPFPSGDEGGLSEEDGSGSSLTATKSW